LTGGSGGKLAERADLVVRAGGTTDTARIQETHILVGHVICKQVDVLLFGSEPSPQPSPRGRGREDVRRRQG
jgi:D-sedoheptulose 7-phosphate isomerase